MSDKKILLVDDDQDIIGPFGRYFKRNGFPNTFTAQKAKEALEFIEKEKPDLMILDIQLNDEIDGVEILRRTRTTLSPNTLVIMVSGHKELHENECRKIGCHDFWGKPIGPDEIVANVKKIFSM